MSSLNPEQTLSGNPTVLFPFPEEKEQRLAIERKKNGTEGGGGGGGGGMGDFNKKYPAD